MLAGAAAGGAEVGQRLRLADGGPYKRLRKSRAKSIVVRLKAGRGYRFYSVATDRAGNREAVPDEPDAKLRT